jgi:acyl carrier protein
MDMDNFIDDASVALEVDRDLLKEEFLLTNSESWDSMGLVMIITLIDRHFQVYIDYIEVHDCSTFGELLHLIQDKVYTGCDNR